MLTWTYIALFCALVTVTLATLLVVVIFWDSYRLTAISILLGMFTLATVFAWQTVTRLTRNKPRLFSATLLELSKDQENLVSHHEP